MTTDTSQDALPEHVERIARIIDPKAWADDRPIPTRADTVAFHAARQRSCEVARAVLAELDALKAQPARGNHHTIAHDGFAGEVIGHYTTREGKRGVVLQQDGTRVVHVYGEKWLTPPIPAPDTLQKDPAR